MLKGIWISLMIFAMAGACWCRAETPSTLPSTHPIDLTQNWSLLQEGTAVGTIEQDAKNPNSSDPHLLRIEVTKTSDPGEGRAGAVNSVTFPVQAGQWWDVTFSGSPQSGSIGLVFSLENSTGTVLAATTLPEIGRAGRGGRRGGATTQPSPFTHYLLSLHTRAADPAAHLVITPIEPTNIWLQGITIALRPPDTDQQK